MFITVKKIILLLRLHAFKSKSVISQLEELWVCDELVLHRRYSPFLREKQMRCDFEKHFKVLLASNLALFICGMVLSACQVLLLQCLGVMVCLLGSTGLINLSIKKMRGQKELVNLNALGAYA